MSKKQKLITKLLERPANFTWNEATKLMGLCNFELINHSGSARMFVHRGSKTKVRLHEPHPRNTLLPYMLEALRDGLLAAGELEDE